MRWWGARPVQGHGRNSCVRQISACMDVFPRVKGTTQSQGSQHNNGSS